MPSTPCIACGKRRGTNVQCLSCRDAAARDLARDAVDVTETGLARVDRGRGLLDGPPWYARLAAGSLVAKARLLAMVLADFASGRYRRLPLAAVGACAAALAYVVSPVELIPDAAVPAGFADDLVVVGLAWAFVKRELRAYCEWKGLSPAHFGLEER